MNERQREIADFVTAAVYDAIERAPAGQRERLREAVKAEDVRARLEDGGLVIYVGGEPLARAEVGVRIDPPESEAVN